MYTVHHNADHHNFTMENNNTILVYKFTIPTAVSVVYLANKCRIDNALRLLLV